MHVDFMMIGAQKSGTTNLAAQLASHSQICFSSIKEPGFFNTNADWRANINAYHQLFEPAEGQLCGEASTMYSFLPETPQTCERIHAYNPDTKLIYIMRQPVDRIVSHYGHNVVRGLEPLSPQDAVSMDARYINRSRYGVQIHPFIELFGRENVLLLIFEEYIRDSNATLEKVAKFLGISSTGFDTVDEIYRHKTVGVPQIKYRPVVAMVQTGLFKSVRNFVPEGIRHTVRYRFLSNRLDSAPQFDSSLRETLWQFLIGDVERVEELLGRELTVWREGAAG